MACALETHAAEANWAAWSVNCGRWTTIVLSDIFAEFKNEPLSGSEDYQALKSYGYEMVKRQRPILNYHLVLLSEMRASPHSPAG